MDRLCRASRQPAGTSVPCRYPTARREDCRVDGMSGAGGAGGRRRDETHGAGIMAVTPAAYHLRYRGAVERGDLTGAILDGRYRVIEPVAQGGMGTVYRA